MKLVLLSCAGVLIVILNKPLGEAFRRANMALGERDYGDWSYRTPLIVLGVLLTCLSFLAD
jgi:hypothetical protein